MRIATRADADADEWPLSPSQPSWSFRRAERRQASSSLLWNGEGEEETSPPPEEDLGTDDETELLFCSLGCFDGFTGSIATDRMVHTLRRSHPRLCVSVVDDVYGGSWDAFWQAHAKHWCPTMTSEDGLHVMRLRRIDSVLWQDVDVYQWTVETEGCMQLCRTFERALRECGGASTLGRMTATCNALVQSPSSTTTWTPLGELPCLSCGDNMAPRGGPARFRETEVRVVLQMDPFRRFRVVDLGGDPMVYLVSGRSRLLPHRAYSTPPQQGPENTTYRNV